MNLRLTAFALLIGAFLTVPCDAAEDSVPDGVTATGYRLVLDTTIKEILNRRTEYEKFIELAFGAASVEIYDADTKAGAAKIRTLRGRPLLTLKLQAKQVLVSGHLALAYRIHAQFTEQVRIKRTGKEVTAATGSREAFHVVPMSDRTIRKMEKRCMTICTRAARDAKK